MRLFFVQMLQIDIINFKSSIKINDKSRLSFKIKFNIKFNDKSRLSSKLRP